MHDRGRRFLTVQQLLEFRRHQETSPLQVQSQQGCIAPFDVGEGILHPLACRVTQVRVRVGLPDDQLALPIIAVVKRSDIKPQNPPRLCSAS